MRQKWLALAFAAFAVLASFGIGSSVQSNSVADAMRTSFNVEGWKTGLALTLFTGLVILGGIKSIARVASIIVPVMAVFYVLGGLVIILLNLGLLMQALTLIFTDAFTGQAAAGGRSEERRVGREGGGCGAGEDARRTNEGWER